MTKQQLKSRRDIQELPFEYLLIINQFHLLGQVLLVNKIGQAVSLIRYSGGLCERFE
jgi:hypothetical protein